MQNYYSTILKSPRYTPITADKEKVLGRQIRSNDHQRTARNRLVCGSLRFVVAMSKRYLGKGLSFEDLVQEGNLGLIEAANRFNPERGFKFDSYAVWWIRRYILFALARVGRIVRVPNTSAGISVEMRKKIRELQQTLQREPTEEEIATGIGIDEKWVHIIENTNNSVSLNVSIGDDTEHIDYLKYPEEQDNIDKEHVNSLLDRLPKREREYIKTYYMSGCTIQLEDIGNSEGLSRERVRQIIEHGLEKLRRMVVKSEVYA
jgi:RNA polymerase primary sigma factor